MKHNVFNNRRAPISVIIPCYRASKTIRRALESISNQTVLPEETILVDDFSEDGTYEFLRELAEHFDHLNVRVYRLLKNRGPGIARNIAWEHATQPWIAFLDADDSWHHKKIEIQYSWINSKQDVTLCAHKTKLFDQALINTVGGSHEPRLVSLWEMLISNRIPTRSVIVRRDISNRFLGKGFTEDYQLWIELIFSRGNVYLLDKYLAYSHEPEFSTGGYSGQIWQHEMRELATLQSLYRQGIINCLTWLLASAWSFIKYIRRCIIRMRIQNYAL
jgi:glycosyltransferase involved in cell wall biosynthesis